MWIRLRKELRALVPPWDQILWLAVFAVLLGRLRLFWFLPIGCWLLCFAVASRLFGAEFDDRTLPRLLAQPISRSRIWAEKMMVGAILIGIASGLPLLALSIEWLAIFRFTERFGTAPFLLPLVALATGSTVSLWLRDSLRALWASMVLPIAFYISVSVLWTFAGGEAAPPAVWIMVPYCAGMLALGYLYFLRLEILAGDGGANRRSTGSRAGQAAVVAVGEPGRGQGLIGALVLKELRLQLSVLTIVPLAVAGWIGLWLLSFQADLPIAGGGTLRDWLSILGYVPAGVLLVIVPALLGAGAVASERQLGVTGWQLALPVASRLQWRFKLAVCMLLTLASALLAMLLNWPLPSQWRSPAALPGLILWFLPWSLLALTIGLFGSRYARGPFQALGLAVIFSAGLSYVWGLLEATGHAVATMWASGFAPWLHLGGWRTSGLVDIVMCLTLFGMIWMAPRQEQWISGRQPAHSLGLVTFAALAVLALLMQLLMVTWTGQQLEAGRDSQLGRSLRHVTPAP